ncbi:Arm DNA-binding domain-containing protein [Crenobacter cavernae]|uniref:DUF4102 domain-containing protein n=1 Tax=Crenobacter cavernae TaxID=2290923 RepID=A0A345Y7R9_9NEIS|nr:Arm DNA-binding domain-containing protein [Crenobacter cavernae]AXK39971.1 DUF4102 domain-containing protein [Crenobacter cavernae]
MPTKPYETQHPSGFQPSAAPYKVRYGKNLVLLVEPRGGKYWRMNYRFEGKRKTLALGVFPAVSLEEALMRRDEAQALLADGIDPMDERKTAKAARPKPMRRALRFSLSETGGLDIETPANHIRLSPAQTQALIEFLAEQGALKGDEPCR